MILKIMQMRIRLRGLFFFFIFFCEKIFGQLKDSQTSRFFLLSRTQKASEKANKFIIILPLVPWEPAEPTRGPVFV